MSVLTRPLVYEDLLQMPEDGKRYEIIRGELEVAASPTPDHQAVVSDTNDLLKAFVRANDLGKVYLGPVDVRLTPHDIVVPDILFVAKARLGIVGPSLIEGAPDLVVEVLSPSNRAHDQVRKAALYAAARVPEYWLIDPTYATIEIRSLVAGVYEPVRPERDGRIGSVVLPGLVVDPAVVFASIR